MQNGLYGIKLEMMNLNLTTSPPPFFFTTNLVLQITFDPVALHSVNSKKKKKKKHSLLFPDSFHFETCDFCKYFFLSGTLSKAISSIVNHFEIPSERSAILLLRFIWELLTLCMVAL